MNSWYIPWRGTFSVKAHLCCAAAGRLRSECGRSFEKMDMVPASIGYTRCKRCERKEKP